MESNTHSTCSTDGLTALAALVDQLAAEDRAGLTDAVRAERVLVLRRLLDRLEGHWLQELATVDAHGPPAPTRASRPPPPPAGCATAFTWGRPRPTVPCAPPGRCSAVP